MVIKHELCHALGVPAHRSHAWCDQHCTRPECILYPRPDARAILSAALHCFSPPMDLCMLCQQEIHKAQLPAGGKLVNPDHPYDHVEWLNTIVELNPDNPRALLLVAEGYYLAKQYKRVALTLKELLRLHPEDSRALHLFAWTLATCSDDDVRDGSQAVELAERACSLTEWKDHRLVDTLAAAYAESGQFDLAIEFQEKAIELAGDSLAKGYRRKVRLYRARMPYVNHR